MTLEGFAGFFFLGGGGVTIMMIFIFFGMRTCDHISRQNKWKTCLEDLTKLKKCQCHEDANVMF